MKDFRLSRGLCAIVGESLSGSHTTLDALFHSSGAPGDPPDLAHHSKWKEWLFRAGLDPDVDSLRVLGNVLEEFMDVEPEEEDALEQWSKNRSRVEKALAKNGLEYYQGGRVIPNGEPLSSGTLDSGSDASVYPNGKTGPNSIDDLISVIARGIPRAIYPLSHRRKDAVSLSFRSEYDVQDLLHAMLRPWVADVRAEEFTPSYAGSSTRMDFLLPDHSVVIETKIVRDTSHARKVGDELIIDIAHYAVHPNCNHLWCVVYDPERLIKNAGGLESDLEGEHTNGSNRVCVRVIVI